MVGGIDDVWEQRRGRESNHGWTMYLPTPHAFVFGILRGDSFVYRQWVTREQMYIWLQLQLQLQLQLHAVLCSPESARADRYVLCYTVSTPPYVYWYLLTTAVFFCASLRILGDTRHPPVGWFIIHRPFIHLTNRWRGRQAI